MLRPSVKFLTVEQVLRIHARLLDGYGGTPGILNLGAVDSALYRCAWGPFEGTPTPEQRAALLLRGLCQDHPFADGNKRTALAAALTFLANNGEAKHVLPAEGLPFMVGVAQGNRTLGDIADWLASRSRNLKEGGD